MENFRPFKADFIYPINDIYPSNCTSPFLVFSLILWTFLFVECDELLAVFNNFP